MNVTVSQSPRQLLVTVCVSAAVAAAAFIAFVLPAEYGLDPTGAGSAMGIKDMGGVQVSALSHTRLPVHSDEVSFPLAPFESVEYKYELDAGEAMLYAWSAPGELVYDFHSEQAGTDPEDAISFAVGKGESDQGAYVAPYSGIHGWFWENRGQSEVSVTLKTHGTFRASITFSPAGEYRRSFSSD